MTQPRISSEISPVPFASDQPGGGVHCGPRKAAVMAVATRLTVSENGQSAGSLEENRYYGWLAVTDCEGQLLFGSSGAAEVATFFRSAAKPFQAFPLLEEGFASALSTEELALTCASHTGSERHLALVRAILEKAGALEKAETLLQCGSHMPDDPDMQRQLQTGERALSRLHNNCSGKHAGMLLFCRMAGLDMETYLDPAHPLQKRILEVIRRWGGVQEVPIGIDGCGAPVFYLPLTAMARLYAHLGNSVPFNALRSAMTAHPEIVGGSVRVDTALMQASGGKLLAKVGADGVLCISRVGAGEGLAFKLADGSGFVRDLVIVEILRRLGWLNEEALQDNRLSSFIYRKERMNTQNRIIGHYHVHLDPA